MEVLFFYPLRQRKMTVKLVAGEKKASTNLRNSHKEHNGGPRRRLEQQEI